VGEVTLTHRIGIMQGRLSPRPPGKLQAFPSASWRQEFDRAKELGFDHIEWIFEADRAEENPISSSGGRSTIRRAMLESGVFVRSVCADYFMVHRLAGAGAAAVRENVEVLKQLIERARELGAERILLPLLETAAVDTPELEDEVVASLASAAPFAEAAGIVLGLEMEIAGPEYAALIGRVGHPSVRAYYDVGNSTAQGFDAATDIVPLLSRLFAVHVKDRKRGSSSVPFGSGDANFAGFFATLASSRFDGDFVLQHYFDSDPLGSAKASLDFVRAGLRRAAEHAA
jgi:hexulose-6-phosphate isomerase